MSYPMQTRPNTRLIRHMATRIKKAALKMSRSQTALLFGMVTPDGRPNVKAVTLIQEGHIPANKDTQRRWGLLGKDAIPAVIPDEPARRVLYGAWNLHGCWVDPEDYFGARS